VERELPVLVRNGSAAQWSMLRHTLSHSQLVAKHGEQKVVVSAVPYHDGVAQSSSTTLGDYASRVKSGRAGADYLFESLLPGALRTAVEDHLPVQLTSVVAPDWLEGRSVQFTLGGAGSGAPPHYHKAAVNTLVYGRKRWWLSPPRDALYSNIPSSEWVRDGGPTRMRAHGRMLLECTQHAGDVLYLPNFWGHAVLNLEPSVAVASELPTPLWTMRLRPGYSL
jgi:hypothetical protein